MRNGFTLLLSVLILSIAMSVSLGVFNLIFAEILLSGTGRSSQTAFYAADTGIECALYWDIWQSAFSTSTVNTIECVEQNAQVGGSEVSTFDLNLENGSCVNVTVDKSGVNTVITSLGYSPCSGPRRVERGLRVSY